MQKIITVIPSTTSPITIKSNYHYCYHGWFVGSKTLKFHPLEYFHHMCFLSLFSDPNACQRQFCFSQQNRELVCIQLPAGTPHPWPHLLNQPIGSIQDGGGAIVSTN